MIEADDAVVAGRPVVGPVGAVAPDEEFPPNRSFPQVGRN
jgi:hypothetical protein